MPTAELVLDWRRPVSDEEIVDLTVSHGGSPQPGWWDRIRGHSLGWVTARTHSGLLVGFVNVAWDGGDHAFLIDTKTRPSHQRQGVGTAVVRRAVEEARAAGCEWMFVDFEPHLETFYLESCGFRPTAAGLVHLRQARQRSARTQELEAFEHRDDGNFEVVIDPGRVGGVGPGDAYDQDGKT